MINLSRPSRSTLGVVDKTDRFDRWFNRAVTYLLNFALLGYILVTYSGWSGH